MNLYVIIFSLLFLSTTVKAQKYDFVLKSVFEPYVLTDAKPGEVSHALFLTAEQSWQSSNKKNKILAQFNLESSSYQINDTKYQHSEIFPGELFYEWSHLFQRLSFGYQYLHLIDGFDTVGMESLNPEDLNQSFFAKSYLRYRSVPALSYKLIFSNISLQFINVFQPKANADNAFLLNQFISNTNFSYHGDADEAKFFKRNDYGLRVLGSAGLFDWSLYGLHVYDKTPVYVFDLGQLTMTKTQLPYKSYGGNLTLDLKSHIVRLDFKSNERRNFLTENLQLAPVNEVLFNLGYALPEFKDTRISFNYSQSELSEKLDYLTRKQKIQDIYIQLEKTINANFSLNSLLIQRVSDSGYAAQIEIVNNISKSQDIRFGAEYFDNKENTTFGQLKDFSRIYIGITAVTSNQ